MGGDGGTKAVVRRFFRGAKGVNLDATGETETVTKQQQATDVATTCVYSQEPLKEPIVCCALGFLYNKESIYKALLEKTLLLEEFQWFRHIRRSRDLFDVKLKKNPLYPEKSSFQFTCPFTQQELNGLNPFAALKQSGSVVSLKALKEMSDLEKESPVKLFPTKEEIRARRTELEQAQTERKKKKKEKKAKRQHVAEGSVCRKNRKRK